MSNSCDRRLIAPRPLPGLPPVEYPSRRHLAMSSIPGPRSSPMSPTPRASPRSSGCAINSPPPACLTRLLQISIATSAARPASSSLSPCRAASAATARRACAISLDSVTIRLCTSFPTRNRHARACAGLRPDVELVREFARTVEAEAEAVAGREAVAQRKLDVRDAGAVVFERQAQAGALGAFLHTFDAHVAAAAVNHSVTRQLAGGRHDLGLLDQAEAAFHRPAPDDLSCPDYVFSAADRESFDITRHRPARPDARALCASEPGRRRRSLRCVCRATTSPARRA